MERTLVLVKPDGVQRGLIGEVITRLERTGLKLAGMKFIHMSQSLAEEHYAALKDKPFYPGLISFITSGPVVAMVWEGPNAVKVVRKVMGKTNPAEALPGTIRADFGLDTGRNIIHGSDEEPGSAEREVTLHFTPQELITWQRATDGWIIE